MHRLGGKKIFLFGFIAILLIGIPVTIYLVQKQQQTVTHAEKSTTVSFTPESSATAPIHKSVGDAIPLDITVDPGKNLVSFVKLEIQYDAEKLATDSASAFVQNSVVFPSVLEGPVYSPGKISVTLSVGPDPTKSVQTKVKAATVTFKALATTPPGTPTMVTYGAVTQVLSIGSNDQASENVLSASTPAAIEIGGTVLTPTVPVPTAEPSPTIPVTITPTVALSPTPSSTPSANQVPSCSNLAVDRSPSGDVPLALNFSAGGTDGDGTISKITFNFGDGQVSDVVNGGGIGTASASAQAAHTYTIAGTYTASAIFTDNSNGVSDSNSCRQIVTVAGPTAAPSNPVPTIAPTGSSDVAIGIGALVLAFIAGGGFLFFLL